MKKILVLAIALCACLGLLAGCQTAATPTQTVDSYLTALKAQDNAAMGEVYAGKDTVDILTTADSATDGADDSMSIIMSDQALPKLLEFDYELSNEQISDDTATVDIKITTYALGSAIESATTEYLSQAIGLAFSGASQDQMLELANTIYGDKISAMTKTYTQTVTLSLTKTDGKWAVDDLSSNDDFKDAITGGLLTASENLNNAFNS